MKSWSIILAAAFLIFFSSFVARTDYRSVDAGDRVPELALVNGAGELKLSDLKGKYVLVNFWSAANPQSRIDNKLFHELAKKLPAARFHLVSICTDSDALLCRGILKTDGLEETGQYLSTEGKNAAMAKAFGAEDGRYAFLVNPQGIVEAVNPDESNLMKLF